VTRSCDLYRHIEGLVDESEIASDTATCSRGPATRHAEHEQSLGARRRAIAHKHNSKSPSYTRCTKLCIAVCKTRTIDYLSLPNEDFGRVNKRCNPDFRVLFKGVSTQFGPRTIEKVIRKSGLHLLFLLPKSSFGEHRIVLCRGAHSTIQDITCQLPLYTNSAQMEDEGPMGNMEIGSSSILRQTVVE
jgi:hypothetical protein